MHMLLHLLPMEVVSDGINELGKESSSITAKSHASWTPASSNDHLSVLLKSIIKLFHWSQVRKLLKEYVDAHLLQLFVSDSKKRLMCNFSLQHFARFWEWEKSPETCPLCHHHTRDLLVWRQFQPSLPDHLICAEPQSKEPLFSLKLDT